jgi:AraC family transcriptional regulator
MTQQKSQLFLWNGRGLYTGCGLDSDMHKHTAIQLGFSLGEPFQISYLHKKTYDACYNFLIKPGIPHKISAADTLAIILWIEPESNLGRQLIRVPSNHIFDKLAIAQIMQLNVLDNSLNCEQASLLFDQLIDHILPISSETNVFPEALDERVLKIIGYIKEERASTRTASITQLAERASLSPSRLRHTFNQQMAISLKQYILWYRLLNSLEIVLQTHSLTQAAHESGFADAAHMSRTFRQTFGFKPSQILKNSHFIQAISCSTC